MAVKRPGGGNGWTFKQDMSICFGLSTVRVRAFYAGGVLKLCPRESGVGGEGAQQDLIPDVAIYWWEKFVPSFERT